MSNPAKLANRGITVVFRVQAESTQVGFSLVRGDGASRSIGGIDLSVGRRRLSGLSLLQQCARLVQELHLQLAAAGSYTEPASAVGQSLELHQDWVQLRIDLPD